MQLLAQIQKASIKGAVTKYETDQGGRDCAGPPKLLRKECWDNKIFPAEKKGDGISIYRHH